MQQTQQTRCHLRILSGIHADAFCELGGELLTIGGNRDADVALLDDGLAERHLTLRRLTDGSLEIAALADGVIVDGTSLSIQEQRAVTDGATIDLGPIQIEIAFEAAAATHPATGALADLTSRLSSRARGLFPRPGPTSLVIGIVGAALCALLLKAAIWPQTFAHAIAPDDRAQRLTQSPRSLSLGTGSINPEPGSPGQLDPKPISDAALGRSVADAFRAAHVSGVRIDVRSGIVTVDGEILPSSWNDLEKVEQWFDTQYGQRYVLMPNVKKALNQGLSLPIQSVWDGPDPNIVVKGQKYEIGSEVQPGYRIVSISGGAVVIVHSGDRSIFHY